MIIHDGREQGKIWYKLIDVLFIGIVAAICNCNDWEDIEQWAKERIEWLKRYIELQNGVPSHQTIKRIFNCINPKQFEKCFVSWVREIVNLPEGDIISIDGKSLCGTAEKENNNGSGKSAIHIVNAWSSSNKLFIGQVKTSEKSNEITAVPELLDMLIINGCIVTSDAMNCQKDIAKKIVKKNKADYVLALKENHPNLYEEVEEYFNDAESSNFNDPDIENKTTIEKGHGRIEIRKYYFSTDIEWMDARDDWYGLYGIGMVIRKRQTKKGETIEKAYYLCSIKNIEDFARAVRQHWGVESAHWSLDITFREDENRTRKDIAPQNLALLKRLALNVVKKDEEQMLKKSLKRRRLKASLNIEYLEYLLSLSFR